jgi:hypothetical protein
MLRIALALLVLSSSACATSGNGGAAAAMFFAGLGRGIADVQPTPTHQVVHASSWAAGAPCGPGVPCPGGMRCISLNYGPSTCGI